jgi:pyruvate,orthophosphate dikinase
MLGFRGCRLGIVYSEISEMQARAVFEAAAEVQKAGIKVKPEVMIPLVGFKKELDLQVAVVHAAAKAVMAEQKVKLNYMVGTMIEVPRGALTADDGAQTAEFFSLGTDDLTQTCLSMNRAAKPVRKSSQHVDSLGSFRRWSRASTARGARWR